MENLSYHHHLERRIGAVLRVGIWGSSGLMILGLIGAATQSAGFQPPGANPSLKELFLHFFAHPTDASTLMYAGLVCLMLTPILRVLTALFGFAAERDWKFVGVSLAIFLMLLGEVLLSAR